MGPSSGCAARALPPAAAAAATTNDHLVGLLALLARPTLGLAPRRDRVATTRGLALTTTEGVVDRVHGHTTDVRALALPTVPAGLADRDQRGLGVADRSDGGAAVDRHAPHLGGGQAERGEETLLGDELNRGARASTQLGAGPGLQLHVVHHGPDRDVAQWEGVARTDLGALTALEH